MACILIDPEPTLGDDLSDYLRKPARNGIFGLESTIVREGEIRSTKGFVGRERLVRETNLIRQVFLSWGVSGKLSGHQVFVQVHSSEEDWRTGADWQMLIDSMERRRSSIMPSIALRSPSQEKEEPGAEPSLELRGGVNGQHQQ